MEGPSSAGNVLHDSSAAIPPGTSEISESLPSAGQVSNLSGSPSGGSGMEVEVFQLPTTQSALDSSGLPLPVTHFHSHVMTLEEAVSAAPALCKLKSSILFYWIDVVREWDVLFIGAKMERCWIFFIYILFYLTDAKYGIVQPSMASVDVSALLLRLAVYQEKILENQTIQHNMLTSLLLAVGTGVDEEKGDSLSNKPPVKIPLEDHKSRLKYEDWISSSTAVRDGQVRGTSLFWYIRVFNKLRFFK